MEGKKNRQDKKNKRASECPLCEISEETTKRLREAGKDKKTEGKSAKTMKVQLLSLIFIFGLGILAFYLFSSGFFLQLATEKNSTQGETQERNILNILPKGLEVGDFAPDFVSEDVNGDKISLSDFRGKKSVLLIFWATWCGYCAKEKDDLKTFTGRYQDKIKVLAVDSGESRQTIADYIQKENINFLMLLDEQRKIWNQYLVRGTPSHFLIDKDGKIVTMRPGLASLADLEIMLSMILVK